jgi:hypothetical protein
VHFSGFLRFFTFLQPNDTIKIEAGMQADVAQLVEQLIRNRFFAFSGNSSFESVYP